jgi:hypothetical protein
MSKTNGVYNLRGNFYFWMAAWCSNTNNKFNVIVSDACSNTPHHLFQLQATSRSRQVSDLGRNATVAGKITATVLNTQLWGEGEEVGYHAAGRRYEVPESCTKNWRKNKETLLACKYWWRSFLWGDSLLMEADSRKFRRAKSFKNSLQSVHLLFDPQDRSTTFL